MLFLIWSGQTDWNVAGRYTGQTDVPLNDTGWDQAHHLASRLKRSPPDVIVASDLARARETAEIIAASFGLPVQTRLREVPQGEWKGGYFADIVAQYAQEFAEHEANPLAVAPPGGSAGQVLARIRLQAYRSPIEGSGNCCRRPPKLKKLNERKNNILAAAYGLLVIGEKKNDSFNHA